MNDRYEVGYTDARGRDELDGHENRKDAAFRHAQRLAQEEGKAWVYDRYARNSQKAWYWTVDAAGNVTAPPILYGKGQTGL